jgi:hypothetical protein
MEYKVEWEISVDAENPEQAAIAARAAQTRPGTQAVVFDCTPQLELSAKLPDTVRVDLLELEQRNAYSEPPAISLAFDGSETATILHALRILQEMRERPTADFHFGYGCSFAEKKMIHAVINDGKQPDWTEDSCDHFDGLTPLTNEQIDELCERINFSTPTQEAQSPAERNTLDLLNFTAAALNRPAVSPDPRIGANVLKRVIEHLCADQWHQYRADALEIVNEKLEQCFAAEAQGFRCKGCGREESVCSADPCEAVIADRE